MAEPTLSDIVVLLAELQRGQTDLQRGQTDLQRGQTDLQRGQSETNVRLGAVESRLGAVDSRLSAVEGGLSAVEGGLSAVEGGLASLREHVDLGFREVRADIRELDGDLDRHMSTHHKLEEDIAALKARPPLATGRAPRRPRTR